MTMRDKFLVLLSLATAVHGRRLQIFDDQLRGALRSFQGNPTDAPFDTQRALALLLTAFNPASAFNTPLSGVGFAGINTPAASRMLASNRDTGRAPLAALMTQQVELQERHAELNVGDLIKCRVLRIDRERERDNVLLTRAHGKPLEDFEVGQEVDGTITKVMPSCVIVDIGASARALLPKEYLGRSMLGLHAGGGISCRIVDIDLKSRRLRVAAKGFPLKTPEELKVGDVVEGKIMDIKKIGALLHVGTVTTALLSNNLDSPVSEPRKKGDIVKCRIMKVNVDRDNPRKSKLMVSSLENSRRLDESFKVGEKVDGTIETLETFGATVDIGSMKSALLPNSLIGAPGKFALKRGDAIQARVAATNLTAGKIILFTNDAKLPQEFEVGQIVEGTVMRNKNAFVTWVDIGCTADAALPRKFLANRMHKFKKGDTVKCRITSVDAESGYIGLTDRLNTGATPLEELEIGQEVDGNITRILGMGLFLDVGATVDALLPTGLMGDELLEAVMVKKKFRQLKVGDIIKCYISKVDLDKQELAVSFKKVEGIPIEDFKNGQEIEGTVMNISSAGSLIIDIGAVREAYMPSTLMGNLRDDVVIGDKISCYIARVDLEKKSIMLADQFVKDFDDFKVGDEVEGVLQHVEEYGAKVDIGTISSALLPRSMMSSAIESFKKGETIKCRIFSVDRDQSDIILTQRIGIIPFETLEVGKEVEGTIERVTPAGFYIDIAASRSAFLPAAQI